MLDQALGITPANAGNIPTAVFFSAAPQASPPSSPPAAPASAPASSVPTAPPAGLPPPLPPIPLQPPLWSLLQLPRLQPLQRWRFKRRWRECDGSVRLRPETKDGRPAFQSKGGPADPAVGLRGPGRLVAGEMGGRVGVFSPKAYVSKNPFSSSGGGAPGGAPVAPAATEGQAAAAPAFLSSSSSQVALAQAATPQASTANPFGDDDVSFGGSSSTQASSGTEGVPAAAAAATGGAVAGADGAAGAEVPKLLDAQCAALFDFDGQDDDELSFKAGDILIITGELNGWFLDDAETEKRKLAASLHLTVAASYRCLRWIWIQRD